MDKHWKKTLASFFIVSFLVFTPVQTVHSVGAIAYILKEFGLDLIARVLAREFLGKMANGVMDFLEDNGRDGLPNFVTDWRGFLEDAQYRGEDITRAIIGDAIDSGQICEHLRGALAGAFNANKQDGFSAFLHRVDSLSYYVFRNKCTFDFDFNAFRNDFSAGGWAAWNQLIQPQNSAWGVFADSLGEFERQRDFEEERDRSEVEAGSGFTSKLGGDKNGCLISGINSSCLVLGSVLTPAKILETTGSQINLSEFDWITGCDELTECIFNVISAVSGRLMSFGGRIPEEYPEPDKTRHNELLAKARADCIKAGENTCTEKAKFLDCDAAAEGGGGGDIDGGGAGGDSNVDCEELIDEGKFNACMGQVEENCNISSD